MPRTADHTRPALQAPKLHLLPPTLEDTSRSRLQASLEGLRAARRRLAQRLLAKRRRSRLRRAVSLETQLRAAESTLEVRYAERFSQLQQELESDCTQLCFHLLREVLAGCPSALEAALCQSLHKSFSNFPSIKIQKLELSPQLAQAVSNELASLVSMQTKLLPLQFRVHTSQGTFSADLGAQVKACEQQCLRELNKSEEYAATGEPL